MIPLRAFFLQSLHNSIGAVSLEAQFHLLASRIPKLHPLGTLTPLVLDLSLSSPLFFYGLTLTSIYFLPIYLGGYG